MRISILIALIGMICVAGLPAQSLLAFQAGSDLTVPEHLDFRDSADAGNFLEFEIANTGAVAYSFYLTSLASWARVTPDQVVVLPEAAVVIRVEIAEPFTGPQTTEILLTGGIVRPEAGELEDLENCGCYADLVGDMTGLGSIRVSR